MKKVFAVLLVILLCLAGKGVKADTGRATSMREFAEALEEHTARLEDSFTISCDNSVIKALKQESPIGKGSTLLSEFMSLVGCTGSCRYGWETHGILMSDVSYYPGWRILKLWQEGRTDLLSVREKQTLEAAQALVSGAQGSDLEKERYIYDTLCERITYQLDEKSEQSEEKDCAIGALLNGAADCDGYADAMVLCCGLAGIPCRYMHGESRKPALPDSPDGNHMWNLVRIDGNWLMCDVTWGDQEETSYLYFNLGKQDASDSYAWCYETLFTNVIDTADFPRHRIADQQPATVRTQKDVYLAARTAFSSGQRRLTLFCPEERLWEEDLDTFISMLAHGGFGSISYDKTGRLFEAVNHPNVDIFSFCDTEEDILAEIDRFTESKTASFTLYPAPELSDTLLSNNYEQLENLLGKAVYSRGVSSFRYGTDGSSITVSDIVYYDNYCLASSEEEVTDYLQKARRTGLNEVRVYCTPSLYADLMVNQSSRFFTLLQNAGFSVQSISYSEAYGLLLAENLH